MTTPAKCAHPACNCAAAEGKHYCSATCADAKGMVELTCQCQHLECQSKSLKV